MVWATVLLYAGGFTTSIEAGMAFLDWPLSNGSINPPGWTRESDQLAEHSHRLLGMKLGLLGIVMVIWTQLLEARRKVRWLAAGLLGMIIFQGILGGLRVLLDQQNLLTESNLVAQTFAVLHACGAQIVVCMLVALTVVNSRFWHNRSKITVSAYASRITARWGMIACAAVFVQILLGAIMRHGKVGLAIPTFPYSTAQGDWLPAFWNWGIAVNFSHRVGAIVVTVLLLVVVVRVLRQADLRRALLTPTLAVPALLIVQITLGALTVWKQLNPYAATLHMLVGAFLLASVWLVTLLCIGFSRASQTAPSPDSVRSRTSPGSMEPVLR